MFVQEVCQAVLHMGQMGCSEVVAFHTEFFFGLNLGRDHFF